MATVYWRYPAEKLDRLRALLGDDWPGGVSGVARFVVQVLQGESLCPGSEDSFRTELGRCCGAARDDGGTGTISGPNMRRLMVAFGIAKDDRVWFVDGDLAAFDRGLAGLAFCAPVPGVVEEEFGPGLKLISNHTTNVWNREFLTDISGVQGRPLGVLLELAGRPMGFGAEGYRYGFALVSVVLEFNKGSALRFNAEQDLRHGYRSDRFALKLRGVPHRPELEISTLDGAPFDGLYTTDVLGDLVGATAGDMIEARTRVNKLDGVIFVDKPKAPSRAKRELIACLFSKRLAEVLDEPLGEFATLCRQEILVEEGYDD